ncbi:MAG: asparagine synthase (glutamine-hydrolyzing), partial [Pseudomonadota bacterium]
TLAHRGPDAQGEYVDGPIGLAHNRLSIIDLSGGDQPLTHDSRQLTLIANGEIYNYCEIRERFERVGFHFKTKSDCEVILPLYEKYGVDCVRHLRGMFAFALWDGLNQSLLLARDRMGEKPLYYAHSDDRLIFASELRALMSSGLVAKEFDAREIFKYFRYQYVPEPRTPFKDIHKVPAAYTLEIKQPNWSMQMRRYWSPWDVEPISTHPADTLAAAVEDSIQVSLVSDVPVGLSLSGGVDSSVLACFMRKHSDKELHAVSIGYPDADFVDERSQARELAEKLDITFHDVEVSDSEMLNLFPDICAIRDDPVGDISGYNYFAIMQHAHAAGIKVMLQGHGIDELCWGYDWVREAVLINQSGNNSLLSKLATKVRSFIKREEVEARQSLLMYELQPYTQWVMKNRKTVFDANFLEASGWLADLSQQDYGTSTMRLDLEITRLIIDFYLLGNGIAQGDRLSMANSVEVRLPFVDHKLVETVVGLRKFQPDHDKPPKHWLKESVRDLVGETILNRPKKGFAPPGVRWQQALRDNYGADLVEGYLV